MKKVLGLDLGSASIGWALIAVDENDENKKDKAQEIIGIGSRIVPLSDEESKFDQGNGETKNQKRTQQRGLRRTYDRRRRRKNRLRQRLASLGMLPDDSLMKLPIMELWTLRAEAANPEVRLTLPQIGRVLYHLDQKRGYRHGRDDFANENKKNSDYVAEINNNHKEIKSKSQTLGQFFAQKILESKRENEKGSFYTYRAKGQIFPRAAHIEEFERIMENQRPYYPEIITDKLIKELRDEIIFYQRPLKSCKHLVSRCQFTQKEYGVKKDGTPILGGPKVAPISSPIFQYYRIWESINNIVLSNKNGEERELSIDEKKRIFYYLDNNSVIKLSTLLKELSLNKNEWTGSEALKKGINGNICKLALKKVLEKASENSEKILIENTREDLLKFDLKVIELEKVNSETGEISTYLAIDPAFEKEPLYQLWHVVYSIPNKEELAKVLNKRFGIDDQAVVDELFKLNFVGKGYSKLSTRFIRFLLPHLMEGDKYSEACAKININHSNSLTKEENLNRNLLSQLPLIKKNELRQPIVERILNQMIRLVNELLLKYGKIDEIRLELSRELKQSKEERNATFLRNNEIERQSKDCAEKIKKYDIVASKNKILKYRLWEETKNSCIYCGRKVGLVDFMNGFDVEIEHIIPRSLYFDDSFGNKVCSCRDCNHEKGNRTAFDYMLSKGKAAHEEYLERVEELHKGKLLSDSKRKNLLTPKDKIPTDFITRRLRESQYVAKKAKELLSQVCYNVYSTTGEVTAFFRRIWGYDNVLHEINLAKYKEMDLTEIKEYEHKGGKYSKEVIKNWSKRLDHRHHAIDALVIALTRQSYIQRLNLLSQEEIDLSKEVQISENTLLQKEECNKKRSKLELWARYQPHFSFKDVCDIVDGILVSFKINSRAVSKGKRYIYKQGKRIQVQDGILVPRGPLSEESIYGKIKEVVTVNLKKAFEALETIVNPRIKELITKRIEEFDGDKDKACKSLKTKPIYLDETRKVKLEEVECYEEKVVIRKPISSITKDNVHKIEIVDKKLREKIIEQVGNVADRGSINDKNDCKIQSVRIYSRAKNVLPVKTIEANVAQYVVSGNNYQVAIYEDEKGNLKECVYSLSQAVLCKKYNIPLERENTDEIWDAIGQNNSGQKLPEALWEFLPEPHLNLKLTITKGDMFILGMEEEAFGEALANKDYRLLNKYLYRVQKFSSKDYYFRKHTESKLIEKSEGVVNSKVEEAKVFYRINSLKDLFEINPHKVRINVLGEIFPI